MKSSRQRPGTQGIRRSPTTVPTCWFLMRRSRRQEKRRKSSAISELGVWSGRRDSNPDPLVPNQMRYQAALRPDSSVLSHVT